MTGIEVLDKELDRNKVWNVLVRFKTLDGKYIFFDKYEYRYKFVLKGENTNDVFFNENVINLAINNKLPEAILTLRFPYMFVDENMEFPDNYEIMQQEIENEKIYGANNGKPDVIYATVNKKDQ